MLAGIDEVAAECGFDVLASFVGKSRSRPELVKSLMAQGRVDALLLLNLESSSDLKPNDAPNTILFFCLYFSVQDSKSPVARSSPMRAR